ncbi:MAG TPA: hypothetical protein VFP91_19910, partial [Vicinamibacterales bacterium]|nr:hypothetical protein [Vicinamibacterales bacterium]
GFGWAQADMTVRRDVPIQGSIRLQLRVDFFNITNTPSFWMTGSAVGTSSLDVSNPLFGVAATTLNNSLGSGGAAGGYSPLYQIGGPRTIQFSAKVLF